MFVLPGAAAFDVRAIRSGCDGFRCSRCVVLWRSLFELLEWLSMLVPPLVRMGYERALALGGLGGVLSVQRVADFILGWARAS